MSKKKILVLFSLLLSVLLTFTVIGCTGETPAPDACAHKWSDASCTEPATCSLCKETKGDPLGHTGGEASCSSSAVCTRCGAEYSEPTNHDWGDWVSEDGVHIRTCKTNENHKEAAACSGGNATCKSLAVCSVCEHEYGALAEHAFGNWQITKPVGCTEDGERVGTCTTAGCTADTTENVPATGHSYTDTVTEPTCTERGYTTHTCSCGNEFIDTYTDLAEHAWDIPARTCEAGQTCSECGDKTDPLGHDYSVSSAEASCTEAASVTYTCKRDGCTHSYKDEIGTPKGHKTDGVTPTLVAVEGKSCKFVQHYTCSECGEDVEGQTVEHHESFTASIKTPATCMTEGAKELTCTACGYVKAETEVIPVDTVTGHLWNEGTKSGTTTTYTCQIKDCGKTKTSVEVKADEKVNAEDVKDSELQLGGGANITLGDAANTIGNKDVTISATTVDKSTLGLSPEEAEQVGENEVYDFSIKDGNKLISDFGNGYVTVSLPYKLKDGENIDNIAVWYIDDSGKLTSIKATYNNGYVSFKTNHFSYYAVTELTPKDTCKVYGHSFSTVEVLPTCTEDGYTLYYCLRCGHSEKRVGDKAIGHSYAEDRENSTAASCTEGGKTAYICANCNHSYKISTPALMHKWVESETVAPSCIVAGSITYTCENACGDLYIKKLAKLPHELTDTVVAPTCTTSGYTLHKCTTAGCTYSYNDTLTSPIGHKLVGTIAWNAELTEATLSLTCENENCTFTHSVKSEEIAVKDIAPTCDSYGYYECTVSISYGGKAYTDTKTKEYEDKSFRHEYGEYSYDDKSHWGECVLCGAADVASAHEFSTEGVIEKAPTCTEGGVCVYTCVCGYEMKVSIPATGHTFEGGVCTECGASDGTELPPENAVSATYQEIVASFEALIGDGNGIIHHATEAEIKEFGGMITAFCTFVMNDGSYSAIAYQCADEDSYKLVLEEVYASIEGGELEGIKIVALEEYVFILEQRTEGGDEDCNHSFVKRTVEPTCTEDGYTEYVCRECKYTYQDNFVYATGHSYVDENGIPSEVCTVCGEGNNETAPTEGLSETYKKIVQTFVEMAKDGTAVIYHATAADLKEFDGLVSAYCEFILTDGSYEAMIFQCTDENSLKLMLDEIYASIEAGDLKDVELTTLGENVFILEGTNLDDGECEHEYTVERIEPTCTNDGYVAYFCALCNSGYTEVIPAKGHVFHTADGMKFDTCQVCGFKEGEVTPPIVDGLTDTYKEIIASFEAMVADGKAVLIHATAEELASLRGLVSAYCTVSYYDGSFTAQVYQCVNADSYKVMMEEIRSAIDGGELKGWKLITRGENVFTIENRENGGDTCEHDYVEDRVIDATCTEEGYTEFICTQCKNTYRDNFIPATGHVFHSADGMKYDTCQVCGFKEGEEMPPQEGLSQTYLDIVKNFEAMAADGKGITTHLSDAELADVPDGVVVLGVCRFILYDNSYMAQVHQCADEESYNILLDYARQNMGNESGVNITELGEYVFVTEVSTSGGETCEHEYVTEKVEPTCTEDGYITKRCVKCGQGVGTGIPATGHVFHTADGMKFDTCQVCGIKESDITPPEECLHRYNINNRVEPTCTENGFIDYHCPLCNSHYTEMLYATGHYDYNGDALCDSCGEDVGEVTPPIELTNTYLEILEKFENMAAEKDAVIVHATAEDLAPYEGKICAAFTFAFADKSYAAIVYQCTDAASFKLLYEEFRISIDEIGELPGWTLYSRGENVLMLEANELSFESCEHEYTEAYTVPAGCTEDGYTVFICSKCSYELRDNYVNATGHVFHTADGMVYNSCQVCGYTEGEDYCEHDYVAQIETPSTCTADGYIIRVCTKCESRKKEIIYATGHYDYTGDALCDSCGEIIGEVTPPIVDGLTDTYKEVIASFEAMAADGKGFVMHFTDAELATVPEGINLLGACTVLLNDNNYTAQVYQCADEISYQLLLDYTRKNTENEAYGVKIRELGEYVFVLESSSSGGDTCEHDYVTQIDVPSTCTVDGYIIRVCTKCENRAKEIIYATGHYDYNGDALCDRCGEKLGGATIPTEGLTETYLNKVKEFEAMTANGNGRVTHVSPDELEDVPEGCIIYGICSVYLNSGYTATVYQCGDEYSFRLTLDELYAAMESGELPDGFSVCELGEYVFMLEGKNPSSDGCEHIYEIERIEPTCTTSGYVIKQCVNCGEGGEDIIPATGHVFVNENGEVSTVCSVCGAENIPSCVHDYYEKTVEATCQNEGYIIYTCRSCKDSYRITLKRLEHADYDGDGACDSCFAAICTEHSYDPSVYEFNEYTHWFKPTCGCDVRIDESAHIYDTATGNGCAVCGFARENYGCKHSYEIKNRVEPNCTTNGYISYYCSLCNSIYDEVIYSTGHSFVINGMKFDTCQVCGYKEGEITPPDACNHRYELKESFKPTCTENGYANYFCTLCYLEYMETLPAMGHSFVVDGMRFDTCQVCGAWNSDSWDTERPSYVPAEAVRFGNSYYLIVNKTNMKRHEAQAECEAMGGMLACITSPEEQAFIESLNRSGLRLWLGGYRDYDGSWKWISGEAWDYTYWGEGEPNNSSNVVSNERYVTLWPVFWNDLANDNIYEQSGYVCEWRIEDAECAHSYTESYVAPTCTSLGYTVYTCSACNHYYIASIIPSTGEHRDTNADSICDECGEYFGGDDIVTPPTDGCVHEDSDFDGVCDFCNIALTENGCAHEFTETWRTEPTCTGAGHVSLRCQKCGEDRTETIAPTGHLINEPTVMPKCDDEPEYYGLCEICRETVLLTRQIPPHNYNENGVCTGCGKFADTDTNADGNANNPSTGTDVWTDANAGSSSSDANEWASGNDEADGNAENGADIDFIISDGVLSNDAA